MDDTHPLPPWSQEKQDALFAQEGIFTGDYMFGYALKHGAFFQELLQTLLPMTCGQVDKIHTQYSLKETQEAKETRFDVLAYDDTSRSFNLEMQNINMDNLWKRGSAYSSKLTQEAMDKLQKSSTAANQPFRYGDIPDRFLIFLCNFQQTQYPYPIYCNGVGYNDINFPIALNGEYQLFYFLKDYDKVVDPKLKALMCYMATGIVQDELSKKIQQFINNAVNHRDWRQNAMTFAMKLDYMREMSLDEGRKEVKEKMVFSLSDILSPEQIAERVELPLKHVLELLEHRP